MDALERLARFDRAMARVEEGSLAGPVVVEGRRDAAALRTLGVTGEILVYNHQAGGILDLADRLRASPIIVPLFDWDRKGGQLARQFRLQSGHTVRVDWEVRRELARVSPVKCVEDLPAARRQLAERADARRRPGPVG